MVVLELVCGGSVILALMFGPKLYILLCFEAVVVPPKGGGSNENCTTTSPDQPGLPESAAEERPASPASLSGGSTKSTELSYTSPSQQHLVWLADRMMRSSKLMHLCEAVVRKKSRAARKAGEANRAPPLQPIHPFYIPHPPLLPPR